MSHHDAADLAHRLGEQAEAVCRQYLSNGRRQGNYWTVGDVRNAPGRSMFVRLTGLTGVRPANGPTPRRASTATCLTSSVNPSG